ncbi:DNA repair-scaffolding protein isoform X2 [Sceloporus undulatus]|uniref:DNA repair-scaffolding protein isoform X2 n=1 Tax=Sceloporus undulatus TaxID=8520 RepID=UPI001C4DBEEB|nr:DNA repair-scaffolding protein isoform X2 [Sceloporus undulatus]
MLSKKRKRVCCTEFASFPDERPVREGKRNAGPPVAAASISSAWLRCGDGFQTASSLEAKESSEKSSRAKMCFTSLLSSVEGISKSERSSECTDIVWSSSGSEFSDDENRTLTSRFPGLKIEKCRKYDLIYRDECSEGELQVIDWENDSDCEDHVEQPSGSKTDDIPLEISDTDSCTSSNFMLEKKKEDEPKKARSIEISEYSSDSENFEECQVESEAANLDFPQKNQFRFGAETETDIGRSASDWLKSAQTLLQTPKKKIIKSLKTPEDSAKKRKLLRGGLAERLNTLQNRERTAISFWRHQCNSDGQTLSGNKSGVLIVKILEMHEECTLCIALCHHLAQTTSDTSSAKEIADIQPKLKVLFAKETAAHLKAALNDVVHIHPPWQKLVLLNETIPVIMNTYFSQKAILKKPADMERTYFQEPLLNKRNMSLVRIFSLSDVKENWSQASAVNQVSCLHMKNSKAEHAHSNNELRLSLFAVTTLSDSLLDIVETEGTAGGKGIQVQVVVQRVYYLVAKESSRCHLQRNNLSQNMAPWLNSDLPNVRLCILVQDTYGMFSEIQFQVPFSSPEPIEEYSKRWEGKHSRLSGMKILQRVVRGKVLGLFSLIDSLWPPRLPLKVPGRSQENDMITADMPPPSFCYILIASSDQRHIEVDEGEQISNLYFPPAVQCLKDILQTYNLYQCCSFWAHVLYRRLQEKGNPLSSQTQCWLFVTDLSLQSGAEVSPGTPKVLPVSVASSCVIDGGVKEALKSTSPCVVFFKDAVYGNGRIICIERTVLLLQKPLLCRAADADITKLTGPVELDELDSATQVNSICTVRGIVVGVNEKTAFSWPTCNRCGNGNVEQHPQDRELLYCSQCCEAIISPVIKMHLEVFVHCQSRPSSTVKIKLLQKTISSLLDSSTTEDGSYEVKNVLGKEVGFLYCYVQSVTNHPSSCIGLEEIVLLDAGRKERK